MPTCLECGDSLGEWDVACDGCHHFVHKDCTNGYIIWPKFDGGDIALLFCKGCEAYHHSVKDDLL